MMKKGDTILKTALWKYVQTSGNLTKTVEFFKYFKCHTNLKRNMKQIKKFEDNENKDKAGPLKPDKKN